MSSLISSDILCCSFITYFSVIRDAGACSRKPSTRLPSTIFSNDFINNKVNATGLQSLKQFGAWILQEYRNQMWVLTDSMFGWTKKKMKLYQQFGTVLGNTVSDPVKTRTLFYMVEEFFLTFALFTSLTEYRIYFHCAIAKVHTFSKSCWGKWYTDKRRGPFQLKMIKIPHFHMPAGLDVLKVSANLVNSIGRTTVEKIHWQMFRNCRCVSPIPVPHW